MADPSVFDFLRIPPDVLIALDNRTFHFAVQPYHYVIRLTHIIAMAGFFGGIAFLDLRMIGLRPKVALHMLSQQSLFWIYIFFGLTIITGIPLFLFDPVKVGSHAYFAPKLALIVIGLLNAALFTRWSRAHPEEIDAITPWQARLAGALSFCLWTGVLICSSMNVEGVPKVFLR